MIPDFTNPAACDWWFGKRQYLLDMGVDGFKTDGGEFVYDDGARFFDGRTGAQMKNGYAMVYTRAYTDFIKDDRMLFPGPDIRELRPRLCTGPGISSPLGKNCAMW